MGSPVRNRPPRGSGRGDPYGPADTGSGPGTGPSKGRDRSAASLRAEAPGDEGNTAREERRLDGRLRRATGLLPSDDPPCWLRLVLDKLSLDDISVRIGLVRSRSARGCLHLPTLAQHRYRIRRKDVRTTARRNVAGPRRGAAYTVGTACPQHAIMRRCFKLPEQERHWARSAAAS